MNKDENSPLVLNPIKDIIYYPTNVFINSKLIQNVI